MSIKLSYSAVSTYLTCPYKFKLERIDKVPQDRAGSPLFFGTSIDQASGIIFNDKINDIVEYQEFDRERMKRVFYHSLTYANFNDTVINTSLSPLAKYSKADFDLRLLKEDDKVKIVERANQLQFELSQDDIVLFVEECQEKGKVLDTEELKLYNFIGHLCLYRKGKLMLDALKAWSDLNVKEVLSTQRYFRIANEEGDFYSGLLDLEAIMMDGKQWTIDLKTASNPKSQYPDNCIDDATQLHSYAEVSVRNVGYLVLGKSIRVKEPKVDLRTVCGKVTDEMIDKTFDKIDGVLQAVKREEFPKNFDACFQFGQKCVHWQRCRGIK